MSLGKSLQSASWVSRKQEPRNCQSGSHRAQRKGEHQNLNTKISRPSVCLLHTVEPLQPGAAELRCPNDTSNR